VEVQFGRYQKNILQESSMAKKLLCVSCGSLKRFPHTFTNNTNIYTVLSKSDFMGSLYFFLGTAAES
jgi:hypothetical protein